MQAVVLDAAQTKKGVPIYRDAHKTLTAEAIGYRPPPVSLVICFGLIGAEEVTSEEAGRSVLYGRISILTQRFREISQVDQFVESSVCAG